MPLTTRRTSLPRLTPSGTPKEDPKVCGAENTLRRFHDIMRTRFDGEARATAHTRRVFVFLHPGRKKMIFNSGVHNTLSTFKAWRLKERENERG